MEIKNITNEDLKVAAQKSDKNFNNKIDQSELSLFMINAKKNNCALQDILAIVDTFEVKNNDRMVNEKLKVAQLKEIDSLEKEIKNKKAELEERKSNYMKKNPYKEYSNTGLVTGGIAGGGAGAVAGAKLGTALAGIVATTGVGAVIAPTIPFISTFIGGVAGILGGGYIGSTEIPSAFSKEYNEKKEIADKYYDELVRPLEKHIEELEKELETKRNEFYN